MDFKEKMSKDAVPSQLCIFGVEKPKYKLQTTSFWDQFQRVLKNFCPKTSFNIGHATCKRRLIIIVAPSNGIIVFDPL